MKRKLLALTLAAVLVPTIMRAQEASSEPRRYTVDTVPRTEILSWSYVTDLSGVIRTPQKDSLNSLCLFARDSLQAEIAVVVLPAIDGGRYGSLHEFGVELYNSWGIGGRDSQKGLLIALTTAPGEREVSFITGYGMEGALPDALCKRIQTQVMIPFMREGNYGSGLIAGVEAVNGILRGDVDPDAFADEDDGMGAFLGLLVAGICFLVAVVVVARVSERKKRRKMGKSVTCHKCGVTGDMKYLRSDVISPATARRTGTLRHVYVCRRCGEENYVDETIPRSSSGNSGFGGGSGPVIGGFGGGRSFGGGSFGSFGGGLSGGGGSSTRF